MVNGAPPIVTARPMAEGVTTESSLEQSVRQHQSLDLVVFRHAGGRAEVSAPRSSAQKSPPIEATRSWLA